MRMRKICTNISPCFHQVSMLAVDDMHQNLPPLQKDKYWTDKALSHVFTPARPVFMGSTYDMRSLPVSHTCLANTHSR